MEDQLFRKESMNRISSPEELQDYMRVTSPGIWMVLASVVILLAGFIVCASVGKLETVVPARAVASGGRITAVMEQGTGKTAAGMTAGAESGGTGDSTSGTALNDTAGKGEYILRVAGRDIPVEYSYLDEQGRTVVSAQADLPDGEYEAEVVTDSVSPISFLLN